MMQTIFRVLLYVALGATAIDLPAQNYEITFHVDMTREKPAERVGIRGNTAPLSWEKTWYLTDEDQDGIYTGTIRLNSDKSSLQYKYVSNEDEYELFGADNRVLPLQGEKLDIDDIFNQYTALSKAELADLRFSEGAIREDIGILKKALKSIHPNLYRYISPPQLDSAFSALEQQLIVKNDLSSVYKYITQLLARIQCSHTIPNPWNQTWRTKQALYFQKDHLPFTFRFIEGRMFIERNATEDTRLQAGTEVLSINGAGVAEILERLLPYVSADGSNDAKRINALQLAGAEKFETFDICYALEFEPEDQFHLELRDPNTGQTFQTQVEPLTKTGRDLILRQRYEGFAGKTNDLWQFKILHPKIAYLRLGTFTTWDLEIDWQQFLKDAFQELNSRQIGNLIIDIRGNVGGADEVYRFLLERLLRQTIQYKPEADKVAYDRIPGELRPYISTWDDSFYDLSRQVEQQPDGYYLIRKTEKPIAIKARKDGFTGKVFLITDASNSSATHHMADLFKKYEIGTLVGQTTGGNQRGMNGGLIFFTTLPNTRIEVDIPVFGHYTPAGAPDSGIVPEVVVPIRAEDLITGKDAEMATIMEMIRQAEK